MGQVSVQKKASPVPTAAPKRVLLENLSPPPPVLPWNPPPPQFPPLPPEWKVMGRRKKLLIRGLNITHKFGPVLSFSFVTVFVQFRGTVFLSVKVYICSAKAVIFHAARKESDEEVRFNQPTNQKPTKPFFQSSLSLPSFAVLAMFSMEQDSSIQRGMCGF